MEATIAIGDKPTVPRSSFPRSFLDELMARVDFAELVSHYVVLKQSGEGRYMGRCPFHNEKTPSFSVNAIKGLYHCFGCGVGGSVFDFVMEIEKLSFPEAVRQLATKVGMELPSVSEKPDPLWQALKTAEEFYREQLEKAMPNSPVRRFLDKRAVTDEDVRFWSLGLAPAGWDELFKYLGSKGYSSKDLAEVGLIQTDPTKGKVWDRLRDRLIFPIRSSYGNLLGFGGRSLGDAEPKYLNSPESRFFHKKEILYGLDKAHAEIVSRGHALIVEGYIDVISMHRAGQNNAVAPMGTAFSPEQARLLRRFTDKVKLLYDRDEAGRKAQERTVEILWEEGLEVKISLVPAGLDPDDLVRERGKPGVVEVLGGSMTPVEYFLNPEVLNITTRRECGKKLEAMLIKVTDTVYLEALFDEYSKLIEIPKEHLQIRLKAYSDSKGEPITTQEPTVKMSGKGDPSEKLLCYLAAYDVRFARDLSRLLDEDEVGSELLSTMLHHIALQLKAGELDFEKLMELWEDLKLMEQLATLANDPKLKLKNGSDPYETLLEVKSRTIRKKIDELHTQMGGYGDTSSSQELLVEVTNLTKMLDVIRLSKTNRLSAREAMESILNLMQNNGVKNI